MDAIIATMIHSVTGVYAITASKLDSTLDLVLHASPDASSGFKGFKLHFEETGPQPWTISTKLQLR